MRKLIKDNLITSSILILRNSEGVLSKEASAFLLSLIQKARRQDKLQMVNLGIVDALAEACLKAIDDQSHCMKLLDITIHLLDAGLEESVMSNSPYHVAELMLNSYCLDAIEKLSHSANRDISNYATEVLNYFFDSDKFT